MSDPIFAPDRIGPYVSAAGILTSKENNKSLRLLRKEMYGHLQTVAKQYYAGNTQYVDAFMQLYCLGEDERKAAKLKQEEVRG